MKLRHYLGGIWPSGDQLQIGHLANGSQQSSGQRRCRLSCSDGLPTTCCCSVCMGCCCGGGSDGQALLVHDDGKVARAVRLLKPWCWNYLVVATPKIMHCRERSERLHVWNEDKGSQEIMEWGWSIMHDTNQLLRVWFHRSPVIDRPDSWASFRYWWRSWSSHHGRLYWGA